MQRPCLHLLAVRFRAPGGLGSEGDRALPGALFADAPPTDLDIPVQRHHASAVACLIKSLRCKYRAVSVHGIARVTQPLCTVAPVKFGNLWILAHDPDCLEVSEPSSSSKMVSASLRLGAWGSCQGPQEGPTSTERDASSPQKHDKSLNV